VRERECVCVYVCVCAIIHTHTGSKGVAASIEAAAVVRDLLLVKE